ncbi:transcriptional regulator, SarA/Rot family [uncultured Clostridium sp.]|uniref:MarR family winged helix-turn-helix transcriptional regulator n=1 Tax=uncultured Clostridium sp. TaxID=59620 RepID=UPI0028E8CD49|nr:MarR family transcriptional regulator [uncultured Clostridium sp.]
MGKTEKQEIIFGSILLLSNKLQTLGDQVLPELTLKQWFLLIVMTKMEEDDATVNEIAKYMGSSRQNIKKMLLSLEKKGFVSIKKSNIDARALSVSLTPQAQDVLNEIEQYSLNNIARVFENITETELDAVVEVIKKMNENIEKFQSEVQTNEK